jgi:hypothetical protein
MNFVDVAKQEREIEQLEARKAELAELGQRRRENFDGSS